MATKWWKLIKIKFWWLTIWLQNASLILKNEEKKKMNRDATEWTMVFVVIFKRSLLNSHTESWSNSLHIDFYTVNKNRENIYILQKTTLHLAYKSKTRLHKSSHSTDTIQMMKMITRYSWRCYVKVSFYTTI